DQRPAEALVWDEPTRVRLPLVAGLLDGCSGPGLAQGIPDRCAERLEQLCRYTGLILGPDHSVQPAEGIELPQRLQTPPPSARGETGALEWPFRIEVAEQAGTYHGFTLDGNRRMLLADGTVS